MRGLECRANLVHLRLGLLHGDSRLQPGDALEVDAHGLRISDPLVRRNDVGDPEVGRADRPNWIGEVRRHDARDFVVPALEGNRASDDGRICAEAPAPEPVAQHRDAVTTVDFLVDLQRAADRRLHSKHVEEVRRHPLRAQILGLGARLAQRGRSAGDRRDRLEHLLLGRPVHVVLRRDAAD